MTSNQITNKRIFDILLAAVLIYFFILPILILVVLASLDTKRIGIFSQKRVGENAELFSLYKIRTMRGKPSSTVTISDDPNITSMGRWLRKTKLDELPQLFNILIGDMSFVGPRPDVPGFADQLVGEDRIILSIKPGLTGPASLHFRDEEELLSCQSKPEEYNREVIWPKKVQLNKEYIKNYSLENDLLYIIKSIF